MRQNAQRCIYDYAPNQMVLKKVQDPTKLGIQTDGPIQSKESTRQQYIDYAVARWRHRANKHTMHHSVPY